MNISGIPKGFDLSKHEWEFREYVRMHPEKQWLQKHKVNRGVKIVSLEEIKQGNVKQSHFVQEYIENPLLISSR